MDLEFMDQPARRLLQQYRHWGAPVMLAGREWTEEERRSELDCGIHQSTMVHVPFLWKDFSSVVGEGQWVEFPSSVAKELPGLSIITPGVK